MRLGRQLKLHLAELFVSSRYFITRRTKEHDLLSLIAELRPMATSKGLIRLGPFGDGGYLVPDDLDGISACFSPGVSNVSGFEKDCADLGMSVYLADRSVERPAEQHENFCFTQKFVGAYADEGFMTLDEWVGASVPGDEADLLLQIDIEGYEYETILSCPHQLMSRFRVIVAEFHNLDQLWNKPFFDIASRAFRKILRTHTCVHIHPNNNNKLSRKYGVDIPPLAEFTFLRKDRVIDPMPAVAFPHALDFDNTGNAPQVLPSVWYSTGGIG